MTAPATTGPLAGQVAVVTGGSSGLGEAFARTLGAAGATVVIGALRGSGVDEAVDRLTALGVDAVGFELDVADLSEIERMRDMAVQYGPLGVWVNNAGAAGVYGPIHQHPGEAFDRVVDANIRGVLHGTRTAVETMVDQGSGRIVNVWGKGADKPVPMQSVYASSKAWNKMFTRTVRAELKDTGVRIHGYDPGLVKTEMLGHVTIAPGQEKRVRALPYVVGLWGQSPDDAAAPIVDLVTGDRDDFRDLTLPTVLGRGLRSALRGNLLRRNRMDMVVTTIS